MRLEGLRLLRAGESGLLRITPDADAGEPVGGRAHGRQPVPVRRHAGDLPGVDGPAHDGRRVRRGAGGPRAGAGGARAGLRRPDRDRPGGADRAGHRAVVVASHGRDEAPVLRAALAAGVPYVALVASRRRAAGCGPSWPRWACRTSRSSPDPARPGWTSGRAAAGDRAVGVRGDGRGPARVAPPAERSPACRAGRPEVAAIRSAEWRCWWREGRCRRATCTSAGPDVSPPGRPALRVETGPAAPSTVTVWPVSAAPWRRARRPPRGCRTPGPPRRRASWGHPSPSPARPR